MRSFGRLGNLNAPRTPRIVVFEGREKNIKTWCSTVKKPTTTLNEFT
jgi:hypothetical protein|uniref:Uncharacterized protein n=1 Tax=Mus musculus TaxID=10090 RepID=Q3TQQ6_MOUSE|nr:unnamed protein product [Mus musculus]